MDKKNKQEIIDANESLDFSIPLGKPKKSTNSFEKLKVYIQNVNNFQTKEPEIVSLKSQIVKFSFLFTKQHFRRKLLILILLAIGMSVCTLFLIKNSGLYSAGIAGIFQGIARITQASLYKDGINREVADAIYNAIFWGSYFVANIPLLMFAHKHISKKFAILTVVYLLFNQMTGYLLSFIPGIDMINILGDTNSTIDNPIIQAIGLKLTNWGDLGAFSLFVYCVTSGLIISLQYSMLYIIGSSSGGTDIIAMYYAKKKNRPIGSMLAIFNIICIFISVIVGSMSSLLVISPDVFDHGASKTAQLIFSPNLMFSILLTIIISIGINYFFPKSKFTQVKIYTSDATALKNKLQFAGYKHDIFVNQLLNGLSDDVVFTIETICMYIELPDILSTIRSIDNKALISINRLSDIDGNMYIVK